MFDTHNHYATATSLKPIDLINTFLAFHPTPSPIPTCLNLAKYASYKCTRWGWLQISSQRVCIEKKTYGIASLLRYRGLTLLLSLTISRIIYFKTKSPDNSLTISGQNEIPCLFQVFQHFFHDGGSAERKSTMVRKKSNIVLSEKLKIHLN